MLKSFLSVYAPAFGRTIVYMLQSSEYQIMNYLKWLWSVRDFQKVTYRKQLVPTKPAMMLLWAFYACYAVVELIGLLVVLFNIGDINLLIFGLALMFISPILTAHLITVPLILGNLLIIRPAYGAEIMWSVKNFVGHPAIKIAIAGSYGKTTVKEILRTVLDEGKKVEATPANKNVGISHARFVKKLDGDEDILIIEYGESKPGDIMRFARRTHPTVGVITGLAPAHLDKYKTLAAASKDIFSLANYLGDQAVYVNGDSLDIQSFLKKNHIVYSSQGIGDWKVKNIRVSLTGTQFDLGNKNIKLKLKTKLVGRHLIGPVVLAAYLGYMYGLTPKQIEQGVSKIEPFEHRMQPYQLAGAWVIDDTYNGNIEGMKAGLALLKELPAKRKIYVTPGLVDQGSESVRIHKELGTAIKHANPDRVVLMKHSVTKNIIEGLAGYKGELVIEEDPLDFYMNLDKFVATGDLVLMQNDWPDNYQ